MAGLRSRGAGYLLSVSITNLMQAVWFGANFLLYCGCAVGRTGGGVGNNSHDVVGARRLLGGRRHGNKDKQSSGAGVSFQMRGTRAVTSSRLITAI